MDIKKISIICKHSGYYPNDRESSIIIEPQPDGTFNFDGEYVERKDYICTAEAIDMFCKTLLEPPVPEYNFGDVGITQTWPEEHINEALEDLYKPSEAQKKLYSELFLDFQKVHEALDYYFTNLSWSDDYPEIEVQISGKDMDIELTSTSQHLFMIPWKITNKKDDVSYETFNIGISRALDKLLPKLFVNKPRIGGYTIFSAIRERLTYPIWDKWKSLE